MIRNTLLWIVVAVALPGALALAGTVTFTPIGPTTVTPGTDVLFQLDVTADAAGGFATADIIIGANQANDVRFVFDQAWLNAFINIISQNSDQFYAQDYYISGNNGASSNSVGTTIVAGVVIVGTLGLPEGTYTVKVDSAMDRQFSNLSIGGVKETLLGASSFTIQCAAADGNCDGKVNADDFSSMAACLQGPGQPILVGCGAYDTDADGDVDVEDYAVLTNQYNGL